MRYLIIGGAGFIGSYICDKLLTQKNVEKVTVYDNFCSGKKWHIIHHMQDDKFELVEEDIRIDELLKNMDGIDVTIMLAANADIAAAVNDPMIDFNQGTQLVQIVLEAMRRTGCKKLLYASGSGVYGDVGYECVSEDFSPMLPISTYGASKLGCEALICSYCNMFGITASAFRFGNVVGGRQTHGVAYDFLKKLHQNPKFLEILGDGTQSKPYIHVVDVVSAMMTALNLQQENYNVYNVAPAEPASVLEIAEIVLKQLEIEKDLCEFHFTGGDRGWVGDVPVVRLDCRRISNLGWQSTMNSKKAVELAVKEMHINFEKIIGSD